MGGGRWSREQPQKQNDSTVHENAKHMKTTLIQQIGQQIKKKTMIMAASLSQAIKRVQTSQNQKVLVAKPKQAIQNTQNSKKQKDPAPPAQNIERISNRMIKKKNICIKLPTLESNFNWDLKSMSLEKWLQKAESKFKAQNLPESEYVVSAVPFISGLALDWYRNNFENTEDEQNWSAFKAGLQQVYKELDPQIRAMHIITTMSLHMADHNLNPYIARFQQAITDLGPQAPTQKFQCFLFQKGLDLELKSATACDPQTGQAFESLDALIETARAFEQRTTQKAAVLQNQGANSTASKKKQTSQKQQVAKFNIKQSQKFKAESTHTKPVKENAQIFTVPVHLIKTLDKCLPRGQPGWGLRRESEFREIQEKGLCSVCLQAGHKRGSPECSYKVNNLASGSSHLSSSLLQGAF